jgi:hypothetical protein
MKFEYTHEFSAPVERIERLMTHPEINRIMTERMSTIIGTEIKSRTEEGSVVRRKVLYRPEPLIKSVGPIKVEPRWMEWVEESSYDYARHEGRFVNTPVIGQIAEKMVNNGTVRFLPTARGCRRVLTGELTVKIFIVGKIAEKIIASTAEKILKEEAQLLEKLAVAGELS